MIEWTKVKDKLPERHCDVVCINVKYLTGGKVARFLPGDNVFIYYDPARPIPFCLDVTHYIVLPELPR